MSQLKNPKVRQIQSFKTGHRKPAQTLPQKEPLSLLSGNKYNPFLWRKPLSIFQECKSVFNKMFSKDSLLTVFSRHVETSWKSFSKITCWHKGPLWLWLRLFLFVVVIYGTAGKCLQNHSVPWEGFKNHCPRWTSFYGLVFLLRSHIFHPLASK